MLSFFGDVRDAVAVLRDIMDVWDEHGEEAVQEIRQLWKEINDVRKELNDLRNELTSARNEAANIRTELRSGE